MAAPISVFAESEPRREDHFIHLDGVSWQLYEAILEARGDRSAPRITYLEGLLEIMAPSESHELIKSRLGRLLEVYLLHIGIAFNPVGSWTLKNQEKERGAEPDECYKLGDLDASRPHLAIEVVWTSGGINKLEVYRELGVGEVWYWKGGRLQVYVLGRQRYEEREASEVLPEVDLDQLVSFLDQPTHLAMKGYRAALEG